MEPGISRTRLDLDSPERFVALRRELGVSTFGINQIVLRPRQQMRIHRHERQEEVYLVLSGTLSLVVEGDDETVAAGELVRVAPDLKRQLVNRGPGPLHLLAIGGAGEHQGRDGLAFTDWDATDPVSPQEMAMPEDLPATERRG
jgi:mannose-6-phosphate isomerase-like protein (cupin superfamily)